MLTRRRLIQLSAIAPFLPGQRSFAAEAKLSHAVSLFDDIKYAADFKGFDYVNAAAPKGGKWRQAVVGSFDSLNDYTVKGDGPGVGILDTLMVASLDEPATRYALIAEAISYPEDKSSVTFRLNPAAHFHDRVDQANTAGRRDAVAHALERVDHHRRQSSALVRERIGQRLMMNARRAHGIG